METLVSQAPSGPWCEGPRDAKIMFIGEALGDDEVRFKRPFAGRAGALLDDILTYAGLQRESIYITNLFNFHPEGNNLDPFVKFGSDTTKSESLEYHTAVDRLFREINTVKPNVIVTIGKASTYALCGRTAITKVRGSILESKPINARTYKVIPTIHPSAALRGKYIWRLYIAIDLERAVRESSTPEISYPNYTLHVDPTYQEAMEYLAYCQTLPRVGSDIECIYIRDTPHTELTHWGIACSPTEAMCIPFVANQEDNYGPMQEASIMCELSKLSSNPAIKKVGQNYIFDSSFVLRRYNILTRNIDDTMIAEAILHPSFNKGLDFLNSYYTNQPYYKADGKQYIKTARGSEDQFRRYNALDAVTILEIIDKQKQLLTEDNMLWYYEHKCRLIEPLLFMQHVGMLVDIDRKKRLSAEALEKLWDLQEQIEAAVGHEINIDSPDQVKKYFYRERKAKPYTRYDKAKKRSIQTVDADALVRLATQQGFQEARLMVEYRSLRVNRSTFYNMALDPDNRLRCAFDPVGAGSRLSSKKSIFGTGMNMQNQPPAMKRCFIADKGYWCINVDLGQAENRVVAYLWMVTLMMEAFENGEDIHSKTAAGIFRKPIDQISKAKGSAMMNGIPIGAGKYSERDIGKRGNHAFNYDLSPQAFAVKQEMAVAQAKDIYNGYHGTYPEIHAGHRAIREQLKRERQLVDLLGRKREFRGEWGNDLFRAAYSYIPQSTVGNLINIYGVEEIYYNDQRYVGVEMLRQVHDSIEFRFPMSRGPLALADCLLYLKASLERPLEANGRTFVIPMDAAIGFNFGDRSDDNPRGLADLKGDWSSAWKVRDIITDNLCVAA